MLVTPILLSLFLAICSTVLIHSWAWKGIIKRKSLKGNELHRGFNINKNDVPFGKFAILKTSPFILPVLKKYVFLNLFTGELTKYMPENLPKFAE